MKMKYTDGCSCIYTLMELYKPPNYNLNRFLELLDIELEKIVQENKYVYIWGAVCKFII